MECELAYIIAQASLSHFIIVSSCLDTSKEMATMEN